MLYGLMLLSMLLGSGLFLLGVGVAIFMEVGPKVLLSTFWGKVWLFDWFVFLVLVVFAKMFEE